MEWSWAIIQHSLNVKVHSTSFLTRQKIKITSAPSHKKTFATSSVLVWQMGLNELILVIFYKLHSSKWEVAPSKKSTSIKTIASQCHRRLAWVTLWHRCFNLTVYEEIKGGLKPFLSNWSTGSKPDAENDKQVPLCGPQKWGFQKKGRTAATLVWRNWRQSWASARQRTERGFWAYLLNIFEGVCVYVVT